MDHDDPGVASKMTAQPFDGSRAVSKPTTASRSTEEHRYLVGIVSTTGPTRTAQQSTARPRSTLRVATAIRKLCGSLWMKAPIGAGKHLPDGLRILLRRNGAILRLCASSRKPGVEISNGPSSSRRARHVLPRRNCQPSTPAAQQEISSAS